MSCTYFTNTISLQNTDYFWSIKQITQRLKAAELFLRNSMVTSLVFFSALCGNLLQILAATMNCILLFCGRLWNIYLSNKLCKALNSRDLGSCGKPSSQHPWHDSVKKKMTLKMLVLPLVERGKEEKTAATSPCQEPLVVVWLICIHGRHRLYGSLLDFEFYKRM